MEPQDKLKDLQDKEETPKPNEENEYEELSTEEALSSIEEIDKALLKLKNEIAILIALKTLLKHLHND